MKKILLLVLCVSVLSWGRSDALIVGVGFYEKNKQNDLEGIPEDIKNIKTILKTLAVPEKHTVVLHDDQATLKSVRQAFENYIHSKHNKKGNLFVFYYTGHGLQIVDLNGDEAPQKTLDGKVAKAYDEAYAMYDLDYSDIKENNVYLSKGVLLDDEMQNILSEIKSKKILILDKCHSDSSDRGLFSGYEKTIKQIFHMEPSFYKEVLKYTDKNAKSVNTIRLFATKEKQLAETSPLGGLFTQSLLQGLVYSKAKSGKGEVTFQELLDFCEVNIQKLAKNYRENAKKGKINNIYEGLKGAFNPVFKPYSILDSSLTDVFGVKPLVHAEVAEPKYLLEDMLDSLASDSTIKVTIEDNIKVFTLRHKINLDFISKKRGYLNVLLVYKDSYKLFLENEKIQKLKEYKFPKDFYALKTLRAKEPLGVTKIFFILSRQPWEIAKHIRKLKSDDMDLVHSISKQLMPSVRYKKDMNKNIVVVKKNAKEDAPNIVTVSKVEFKVER